MKKLALILTASMLTIGTSQSSTNLNGQEHFGKPTTIAAPQRTATRSVQVLAKKITKPKLFFGKPQRYVSSVDDQEDVIEVDDIITSYRREDLNKLEHDDDLSDRVKWRLFLARQLALLKHKQVHG